MKKFKYLLSIIMLITSLAAFSQTCPTGPEDCYGYGSLSGSDVAVVAWPSTTVSYSLAAGVWCPAGRINCGSATSTFTVTVHKVSGTGSVALNGGSYSSSSTINYQFLLNACSGTQNFSLSFKPDSGGGSTNWQISLSSVSFPGGTNSGLVCNSTTYFACVARSAPLFCIN